MRKEILISFLIIALFNYLNGCVIKNTEKATNNFEKENILYVVLPNFDRIEFNDAGGNYLVMPPMIQGISKKGDEIKVELDSVKEIIVSNPGAVNLEDLNGKVISEIITKEDKLYEFNSKGGTYRKGNNSIEGTDISGLRIKISLDKIREVYSGKLQKVSASEIKLVPDTSIAQIVYNNNKVCIFDENGGRYYKEHGVIEGITPAGVSVAINPDSILYADVERTNVAGTIFANLGIVMLVAGGIVLIIAATKESCPFIYSYDGGKYVFDAEPLGGATCRGLERTGYSEMEHLKGIDNKYKIMVRNEVEETQYIDQISLLRVHHDPDKKVYPDLEGNFYQIKSPVKPIAAFDEKGTDLKKVVSYNDGLSWQTRMPADSNLLKKKYRSTLTFVFPKPDTAKSVKLIVNAGTTLWGSRMIKEMLQLYGNYIDTWYSKINRRGIEYYQMMNFIQNEELYKLKIYVRNNNSWIDKGFINGGGPLISETRIYNLNIGDIKGDSLVIRCNPPYGFWSINYTAVEYKYYSTPVKEKIPMIEAIANGETDIKDKINYRDSIYQVMPKTGDNFYAVFESKDNGNENLSSYYLSTTGYYKIHLAKNHPMELEKLSRLTKPGEIVRWSNEDFIKWKNEYK